MMSALQSSTVDSVITHTVYDPGPYFVKTHTIFHFPTQCFQPQSKPILSLGLSQGVWAITESTSPIALAWDMTLDSFHGVSQVTILGQTVLGVVYVEISHENGGGTHDHTMRRKFHDTLPAWSRQSTRIGASSPVGHL